MMNEFLFGFSTYAPDLFGLCNKMEFPVFIKATYNTTERLILIRELISKSLVKVFSKISYSVIKKAGL
jgi:hypothetical protein